MAVAVNQQPQGKNRQRENFTKIKAKNLFIIKGKKVMGKKELRKCLGVGCGEKVEPPLHFCPKCSRKKLKENNHGKKGRDPANRFSRGKKDG